MRASHSRSKASFAALAGIVLVVLGMQPALVTGQPGSGAASELTAADVDFNGDETINFLDFGPLAEHWRDREPAVDVAPWPAGDGVVDFNDLSALTRFW